MSSYRRRRPTRMRAMTGATSPTRGAIRPTKIARALSFNQGSLVGASRPASDSRAMSGSCMSRARGGWAGSRAEHRRPNRFCPEDVHGSGLRSCGLGLDSPFPPVGRRVGKESPSGRGFGLSWPATCSNAWVARRSRFCGVDKVRRPANGKFASSRAWSSSGCANWPLRSLAAFWYSGLWRPFMEKCTGCKGSLDWVYRQVIPSVPFIRCSAIYTHR